MSGQKRRLVPAGRAAMWLLLLLAVSTFALAGGRGDTSGIHEIETPYVPAESTAPLPMVFEDDVKNVILLIGDGMGLVHAQATRFAVVGPDGRLHFERLPVTGLMDVHAVDKLITDSAASGTAMACGVKTLKGRISMTPDEQVVPTILEAARDKGLATGVISTSSVTHATPASFMAHVLKRSRQLDIAVQIATSGTDVILGGGWKYFTPSDNDGDRQDGRNLLDEMRRDGYQVLRTKEDFLKADAGRKMIGLFQNGYLTTVTTEPTLAEMTAGALDVLDDDPDGFFLMVEGSQIDWAGHDNDFDYMVRQTVLFDDAVRVASEFAQSHPGTLVIVTADHETGGIQVEKGDRDGRNLDIDWASDGHTAQGVPLYAYGPGSLRFTGVFDNTDIARRIAELLALEGIPSE